MLAAADRCVMCGQCLPHCPTYRLHHREAESPRGRIALLQGLASGRLNDSPSLRQHIDSCLACRACEKMCPSQVPYGQLLDAGRALLRERGQTPAPALRHLLKRVSNTPALQRDAHLLRIYQRSGLQHLLRRSGLLKMSGLAAMENRLPSIPAQISLPTFTPAQGKELGQVGLFTGCIASVLEGEVHRATITLLSRLGYAVSVPTTQGCCGALHQHGGEPETGHALARDNLAAFAGLDAVIVTASGCAAQLIEANGNNLAPPFFEACDFLGGLSWPTLHPLPQRVLWHLPCSQRNVLQRPEAIPRLLAHIPRLQLTPLAENDICCGGAGSYPLSQHDNADALRARKLDTLSDSDTSLLVSNNLGCALHLQTGLRERGIVCEVVHPLLLMMRALP